MHVTVRFCVAMTLFYEDDYEEVAAKLAASLRSMRSWSDSWHVPTASAISQARARLGSEPMRELFDRVAVPVAGYGTKGAWLQSRRLMAVDGFALDVPDTPSNVAAFGTPSAGERNSPHPQVRVVGLAECGSHALVAAALGTGTTHEQALLPQLFDSLQTDMLLLADRGYYSYQLWRDARETGAELLWRVTTNLSLPVLRELPDGSYLSVIHDARSSAHRRKLVLDSVRAGEAVHSAQGTVVRVVEYTIPDRSGNKKGEVVRLLTSILEPDDTAAIELATAYQQRWEIESVFDEIKTHQRGPGRILRSGSSDLVEQEVWSLLLAHYAIRSLMCRAADEADIDPDRLSFMRSLRIVRHHVTGQADFSP